MLVINSDGNLILKQAKQFGIPQIEITTKLEFNNTKQLNIFLSHLTNLLENLKSKDPKSDFTINVGTNVSIQGEKKITLQNINSLTLLEEAITFEITRQQGLQAKGIRPIEETRQWDDERKITRSIISRSVYE